MVGIRIRHLPEDLLEKALKIYFSKPEHGGGKIKKIYFPLMNNDAVIIFEDPRVIQSITQFQHKMAGNDLEIEVLPEHMIFSTMEAKVDTNASVILQVSPKLRDEMEFGENIKITQNEDQTYSLQGNWFQLEWAWNYLSCYMKHQEVIQSQIKQTSNSQNHDVPMETEDTSGATSAMNDDDKWKTYRVRSSSPTEVVNSSLRQNIAQRNQVEENLRLSRSPRQPSTTGSFHSNSRSTGQEHDSSGTNTKEETQLYHKSIGSPHESLRDTGSPHSSVHQSSNPQLAEALGSDRPSLAGLKDNITQSYGSGRGNYSSMFRPDPDDYDTGDELDLHGKEHQVPFESVHSSLGMGNKERNTDQNKTFEHYTGTQTAWSGHSSSHKEIQKSMKENKDGKDPSSSKYGKGISLTSDTSGVVDKNYQDPTMNASSRMSPLLNGQLNLNKDRALKRDVEYSAAAGDRGSQSSKLDSLKSAGSSLRSQSKLPDRYAEDQLLYRVAIRNLTVTVYYGDLLEETAEGLINAANCDLDHMGGVAYAISKARGPEMERECREYIRHKGNLRVSECTHTSGGGRLKALHIIQAYGPMWLGEESKEKSANQLRDTFLNCFTYAENKLWIRSLCTPAISTGVFGVPLDICVRGFLDAILIFIDKHPDSRLTDIRLVSNDAESTVTAIVLLQTLLDTGIDQLTAEAVELHKQFTEKSRMNLPRGRPENMDFMTSYHSSRTEGMSNINRRRSSSTSRVTDKKRQEQIGPRVTGYQSPSVTRRDRDFKSERDKDYGSAREKDYRSEREDRGRSRPQSSIDRTPQRVYESSSHNIATDVSRPRTAVDKHSKVTPHIKQSLLTNTDKFTVKTKTSTSYTSSKSRNTALAARDDYRSSISPSSDTSDDAYTSGLTRRNFGYRDEEDFGLQSLPVNLGHDSSFREKFLQLNSEEKREKKVNICAICLDKVKNAKTLSKCDHTFCTVCIDSYFKISKPKCPTCGMLYGQLKGDQPRGGSMTSTTDRTLRIPGYEREDGAIIINYTFPGGIQESNHPRPGRSYKGFSRKAYLPNSVEGREVLRLLKRAFQSRLTFTIGDSRTTGESGVITWNDIHHKTSVTGGPTKFGYPDSTYLKRVKEELASKGIM